jgi:AP-2 complex subunit alpha
MPKNVQQNNAQNAVLFEAINLIIHLDTEQALMKQISTRLGKFIQSRETNVRYLGLEAMTHLAARAETLDPIKQHQAIIIGSLKDRDISVRRKGLDLLYSMCDQTNAQPIVGELLQYLQNADFAIREEMVLKIAILTEKYATDVQWYVDISLRPCQRRSMAKSHSNRHQQRGAPSICCTKYPTVCQSRPLPRDTCQDWWLYSW